jgi:hypothetical protein
MHAVAGLPNALPTSNSKVHSRPQATGVFAARRPNRSRPPPRRTTTVARGKDDDDDDDDDVDDDDVGTA